MADDAGGDLERWFRSGRGPLVHKWLHYFQIYERHLARYRGQPVTLLEIGVFHGGSLAMWAEYLGPQARIIGVDIDPRCVRFASEQVQVYIGDQGDREFLRQLRDAVGRVDVVLDDGGHRMHEQIASLEVLWDCLPEDGTYLVEDTSTSLWPEYDGGHRRAGTFLEFAKDLVDAMHAWHSREDSLAVDSWSRTLRGVHFYDGVVVLDKGHVAEPRHEMRGKAVFELPDLDTMSQGFTGWVRD